MCRCGGASLRGTRRGSRARGRKGPGSVRPHLLATTQGQFVCCCMKQGCYNVVCRAVYSVCWGPLGLATGGGDDAIKVFREEEGDWTCVASQQVGKDGIMVRVIL